MLTFAIPDLHGRLDLLQQALRLLERLHVGGKIVFLGDYIDRGPDSAAILETLMAGPTAMGWEWVCLKGNHEDMMIAAHEDGNADMWLMNGGAQTVASYALQSSSGRVPKYHLDWCKSLPTWHDDGKRLFVHAGVEPGRPIEDQGEHVLLWIRYDPRNADIRWPGRYIVHGHTPERHGPMLYEHRCNLDTYAVGTGRLCIAVFDDETDGKPIEVLEVLDGYRSAA